jgi:hypothetical protein
MRCYDCQMDRRKAALLLLLALPVGACRTLAPAAQRYYVTATPLKLLGADHPGLCFAVDPADQQRIWWWDPGPSGCATQINEGVMRAHYARVTTVASGVVELAFQMALMRGGPRDTRLVLQDGALSEPSSGQRVSITRRDNLDVPFAYRR